MRSGSANCLRKGRSKLLLLLFGALGCCLYPVQAQLNDACTVSVLNRNINVAPDGTWVLSNIPVNQGRVRARATCIFNGLTRFGQSALFTVPLNGTITLQPIVFGAITPIPSLLTLTASPQSITSAGA